MNRKDFAKKYKTEVALMAKEQNVDLGVAADMLISFVSATKEDKEVLYTYPGCEDLYIDNMYSDILKINQDAIEKLIQDEKINISILSTLNK